MPNTSEIVINTSYLIAIVAAIISVIHSHIWQTMNLFLIIHLNLLLEVTNLKIQF